MNPKILILFFTIISSLGIYGEVLAVLNAPTNPEKLAVGEGSAKVGWQWASGGGTINRFVLSYRIAGAAEEWTKKYPSSGVLEYAVMGLNENTTYEWTIMAEATDPSDNSSETPGPNFTTLSGGGGGGGGGGDTPPPINPSDLNPISAKNLADLFDKIFSFLFGLSIFIVPVIVIYAAFLMLMGGGDPVKLAKGRMILLWTAIAFIIILLSRGLPVVFRNLL